MSKQEIYEFIRDNLTLKVTEDSGRDYLYAGEGLTAYKSISIELVLTNPETGNSV